MRIIGGTAKGHTIKAPKGMDTRPTLDRVRESIFNVLAHRGIFGTCVLDYFLVLVQLPLKRSVVELNQRLLLIIALVN